MQPLWSAQGRIREGLAWFNAVLTDEDLQHGEVNPAVRARALAAKAVLDARTHEYDSLDQAEQALAIARGLDDPALLAQALIACGSITAHKPELAEPYFAEAIGLARTIGDQWMLNEIHNWQAYGAASAGDPIRVRAPATTGHDLADAIGNRFVSHACRAYLGWAQMMHGDLRGAAAQFSEVAADADGADDTIGAVLALMGLGYALAYRGDISAARSAADGAIAALGELPGIAERGAYAALGIAAIAAADVSTARDASEAMRSSPGTWCTRSSCDSSTSGFRRLVPPGWPPVLAVSFGQLGIC